MKHGIGIVGYGDMAEWHCTQQYDVLKQFEVRGIWDIRRERRELAEKNGYRVYENLQELLDDGAVELVLIATPNDVHKEISIRAMEAGKAVVCEKPVTLCTADLDEIINVAERTGQFFTVHQNRRWDQDFLTMKKVIEEDVLGRIYRIESRVHGSRGIPNDWRCQKEFGGGMVLDWGVHLLDQALLFYPEARVKTVYATLTHVTNEDVDDGFTVDLGMDNGVHIYVEVGTSNYVSLPRWYVLGNNGTAVIDEWKKLKGRIVYANGSHEESIEPIITATGRTKTMAPRREDCFVTRELPEVAVERNGFYQNVLGVLERREESLIQLSQVRRVMCLMEAVFESAEKQRVIRFED